MNGVGQELIAFHNNVEQVRVLIETGCLNYMRKGKLFVHDDKRPTLFYPSLEAGRLATDNGPDAFRYIWDGRAWWLLGPRGGLKKLASHFPWLTPEKV